jgi:hypothetical protein
MNGSYWEGPMLRSALLFFPGFSFLVFAGPAQAADTPN